MSILPRPLHITFPAAYSPDGRLLGLHMTLWNSLQIWVTLQKSSSLFDCDRQKPRCHTVAMHSKMNIDSLPVANGQRGGRCYAFGLLNIFVPGRKPDPHGARLQQSNVFWIYCSLIHSGAGYQDGFSVHIYEYKILYLICYTIFLLILCRKLTNSTIIIFTGNGPHLLLYCEGEECHSRIWVW